MKNTTIRIKAELENVKRLYCDDEDSSSSLTRDNIQFRKIDKLDIPNSRGTANFMVKWTEYPKYSTINFTKNCCSYGEESNIWKDFASFECRGIEIVDFIPSNNFIVEDTKGKLYYDVNLSEFNWCDYNEENEMCVGIYNLEYEIK